MEERPAGARRLPWQAQFLLLSTIWGLSFLLIKVGDEGLAPLQVALGRVLCGAAALLVVLALRGERLPRDRRLWPHLAMAALLFNAAPFTLFAYGETRVSSVLASIMNATTPLFTLLVATAVFRDERPGRRGLAGLAMGFAGVLVVLGAWRGLAGQDLLGAVLCLGAAGCYGLGFPYARRHLAGRPESTAALAAAQLLCAAAELAVVAPLASGPPATLPVRSLLSVLALGAAGTGVAYLLNYGVLRAAGATVASTVTYVIPIVSTLAGVFLLGEPVTWNEPVGAAVVLLGAAVAQGRLGL